MIGTKWCQCKYGSYFRIEKKRFKFFILAKMFKVWMIGNYKWDYNYLGKFFRKGFMFENSSLLLLQTRLSCSSITLSGSSLFIKHSLDFQDEGKNLSHQSITFSNEAFDCKCQIFSCIKDGRSYNRGTDESLDLQNKSVQNFHEDVLEIQLPTTLPKCKFKVRAEVIQTNKKFFQRFFIMGPYKHVINVSLPVPWFEKFTFQKLYFHTVHRNTSIRRS